MKTLINVHSQISKKIIFSHGAIEKLKEFSLVDWVQEGKRYTSEELAEVIGSYDACITSWGSPRLTAEVIAKAGKLKFVGHAAGSVVPVVDEAIFEKNIVVVNANSALSKSTAELAVALMLAGAWNFNSYSVNLKLGLWTNEGNKLVPGLCGQTVGLIGYGDITREVIRLLKPFDVRILLYSQHCPAEEAESYGVELCSLECLLSSSRIISLHNTLTPLTRGMIGKKELSAVKDGSLIVNTARGPIIDEEALLEDVKSGRLFAALDVYDNEPLDREHDFLKLPNVLCMPHIGGFSSYWRSRMGITVIEDMERWFKGEKPKEQITLEKYRRMTRQ